jgi:hypothetical protein
MIKYNKNMLLKEKKQLNMQNMQNKNDYFKLLLQWNTFLYHLATFKMIIEKYANFYRSLALIITYSRKNVNKHACSLFRNI